jgi:hypothetical protein
MCEWRRFQRYAAVWPGRPERLAALESFPPQLCEQKSLRGFLVASKLAEYAEGLSSTLGLELIDVPFLSDDDLQQVIPKEFHQKRFRRFAKALPKLPASAASPADVAHLSDVSGRGSKAASSHLLGTSPADAHFGENIVHFRRIRQLADGISEEIERDRRRRGKFCGKFCDGGEMAEKVRKTTPFVLEPFFY